MRLSVSNLAWDFNDENFVLPLFVKNNITSIEGVLSKIGKWEDLTEETLKCYLEKLHLIGIDIPSIQSIFYGVKINGIGDTDIFYKHVEKLISICKILGTKIMVFGSPSMRRGVSSEKLSEIFKHVDTLLQDTNIILIIEPNSKIYGGEFFYDLDEIVNFIIENKLKNIKTMVDTHNLILEGFDPSVEYVKHINFISHIHISEVNLFSIEKSETHVKFYETLKINEYEGLITYETNKPSNIIKDVEVFVSLYNSQ